MKNFALLSLLSALLVEGAALSLPPNINRTEFYHQIGQKRQALGALTSMLGKSTLATYEALADTVKVRVAKLATRLEPLLRNSCLSPILQWRV